MFNFSISFIMYSVYFGIVKFAEFDDDVNACAVALDLHRISNCLHLVEVRSSDGSILYHATKTLKDGE